MNNKHNVSATIHISHPLKTALCLDTWPQKPSAINYSGTGVVPIAPTIGFLIPNNPVLAAEPENSQWEIWPAIQDHRRERANRASRAGECSLPEQNLGIAAAMQFRTKIADFPKCNQPCSSSMDKDNRL